MDTALKIDKNFDANSRNCPATNEIRGALSMDVEKPVTVLHLDRGGIFFMVGDSRLAIYDTADRTDLRYWNEVIGSQLGFS